MMSSSVLILLLAALPATTLQPYEAVEPHMGTIFRIKLYASDQSRAQAAFRAAFERIAELDNTLSDYKPESELNLLSTTAIRHPVKVSDDLYRVIEASQNISAETGGAFDITVGPLTHLWRSARKRNMLPEAVEVENAKSRCGYQKLHLNQVRHTVELAEPGMQLDVGGIAKGYAASEALLVLRKTGIESALVAASGDLAFSQAPPGESGWKIGVDSLDDARAPFTRVLLLENGAVSTSGSSEQHLDVSGTRYSHIIDPATGMGLTTDLTATVIAAQGMDADAMATAVTLLGVKRGLEFIEQHPGVDTIIVSKEAGQTKLFESTGLKHKF